MQRFDNPDDPGRSARSGIAHHLRVRRQFHSAGLDASAAPTVACVGRCYGRGAHRFLPARPPLTANIQALKDAVAAAISWRLLPSGHCVSIIGFGKDLGQSPTSLIDFTQTTRHELPHGLSNPITQFTIPHGSNLLTLSLCSAWRKAATAPGTPPSAWVATAVTIEGPWSLLLARNRACSLSLGAGDIINMSAATEAAPLTKLASPCSYCHEHWT